MIHGVRPARRRDASALHQNENGCWRYSDQTGSQRRFVPRIRRAWWDNGVHHARPHAFQAAAVRYSLHDTRRGRARARDHVDAAADAVHGPHGGRSQRCACGVHGRSGGRLVDRGSRRGPPAGRRPERKRHPPSPVRRARGSSSRSPRSRCQPFWGRWPRCSRGPIRTARRPRRSESYV